MRLLILFIIAQVAIYVFLSIIIHDWLVENGLKSNIAWHVPIVMVAIKERGLPGLAWNYLRNRRKEAGDDAQGEG